MPEHDQADDFLRSLLTLRGFLDPEDVAALGVEYTPEEGAPLPAQVALSRPMEQLIERNDGRQETESSFEALERLEVRLLHQLHHGGVLLISDRDDEDAEDADEETGSLDASDPELGKLVAWLELSAKADIAPIYEAEHTISCWMKTAAADEVTRKIRSSALLGALEVGVDPSWSSEAGDDLVQMIRSYEQLRASLVEHHLRLALAAANKYGGPLSQLDRMLAALQGLMKAVDRFEFARGFKFSTFATYWVRQTAGRDRQDFAKPIRLPVHEQDGLAIARKRVRLELGTSVRASTPDELERLRDGPGAISPQARAMSRLIRWADVLIPGADVTCLDAVFNEDRPSPAEVGLRGSVLGRLPRLEAILQATLQELEGVGRRPRKGPSNVEILRARLGLGAPQHLTLEQLGEKAGVTRERIRQREEKTVLQARRALLRVRRAWSRPNE